MHSIALSAIKIINSPRKDVEESLIKKDSQELKPVKQKVEFSCQVIKGRDVEESNESLRIDQSVALDPYKQDASISAYKRDTGNQFRIS